MSDQDPLSHVKRDAEALLILGAFLAFLAVIVLVATVFQRRVMPVWSTVARGWRYC